ncbi:MAG: kelch repeat-containing protein [Actinomycetes bacterium]
MPSQRAVRRLIAVVAVLASVAFAPAAQAGGFDVFTPTGSLVTPRLQETASVLPSGKVLFAGGTISGGVTATTELYDPATGLFAKTGDLATARSEAAAAVLPSGKILIAGGYEGTAGVLASAEIYDPATGLFTSTGNLSEARRGATASVLTSGKVLIAGGINGSSAILNTAELYDPVKGVFTPAGSPLINARYGATALTLPSGKVLLSGGVESVGGFSTAEKGLTSAELYDPGTGLFTATGSLSTVRNGATATVLSGGKVLVVGGRGNKMSPYTQPDVLASAELYDPKTGLFTATGNLIDPRFDATASALPNGKVLIAGGKDKSGSLARSELYDPTTGLFARTGDLITARTEALAVVLRSGKVLIVGGTSNWSATLGWAELYTPTPAKPAAPAVKWSTDKKKQVVTATVDSVSGVSYSLSAKLGSKTRTGVCKTKGAKAVCTLAPGKGKWSFSLTPRNAGGSGPANVKAIKL